MKVQEVGMPTDALSSQVTNGRPQQRNQENHSRRCDSPCKTRQDDTIGSNDGREWAEMVRFLDKFISHYTETLIALRLQAWRSHHRLPHHHTPLKAGSKARADARVRVTGAFAPIMIFPRVCIQSSVRALPSKLLNHPWH